MWKCDKCGHETPTGVEHFCDARPLPDSPAGAPGPWRISDDGFYIQDAHGQFICGLQVGGIERTNKYAIADFILSRVNTAPARPAAAQHEEPKT